MKRTNWIIFIIILSFVISIVFTLLSESLMPNLSILLSILLLLLVILVGILFDMVGVAVTTCDITPFHSMASKKMKSAIVALKLKTHADKVSSICNDTIGDICGIVSGSAGVYLAVKLSEAFNTDVLITSLLISGTVASLTIGGKAIAKSFAINKNVEIVKTFSKVISIFYKK